jgi:predicted MFS family arabinose efflux permease
MWNGFWPLYISALGASARQVGFVIGLRGLLGLLFVLPSGVIAERLSAPRMLACGWMLLAAGLLLIAVAHSWWQLLPALAVLALARPAFPVIDREIAAHSRTPAERVRAFTLIWTLGPSATSLLMPALGGSIAERSGLRAVFVLAAAVSAVSAIIFSTLSSRPAPTRSGENTGTEGFAGGSPRSRERGVSARSRAGYWSMLRQPRIVRLLLVAGALSLTLSVSRTLLPNFLTAVHGVTLEQIGWLGSLGAVGSIGIGLLAARTRWLQQPAAQLRVALLAVALGLALYWFGGAFAVLALAALLGGAALVAEVSLGPALAEAAPEPLRLRAFALTELLRDAAYTIGPVLAGVLYSLHPAAPLLAGIVGIGALLPLAAWAFADA